MLEEGKGYFSDFSKYRKIVTAFIFHGEMPELSAKEKAAAAKAKIGQAPATATLADARALFEARRAASKTPSEPSEPE